MILRPNRFLITSRLVLIALVLLAAIAPVARAADEVSAAALWTWSVPAPSMPDRRAFLWIAPQCRRVRGIVVGLQNMLEKPLFERAAFRAACARNDLAIVMIFAGHDRAPGDEKTPDLRRSGLDVFLNPSFPKGGESPKAAGADLQAVLDALAAESGYAELARAPLMPVGHSSAGSFVWHLARWDASRIFAMMPFKTGLKTDGPSGIPIFNVESEWFDFGGETKNVSSTTQAVTNQAGVRGRNADAQFGFYVDVGSGHCDVSDDSIEVVGQFLDKAVAARIPADGSTTLKPIDLASGALIAPADLGKPDVEPVPFRDWTGDPRQAFWYVDLAFARSVQRHLIAQRAKRPQQINFVKDDGSVSTDGGMFKFSPTFIDDRGTFRVEARAIGTLTKTDLFAAGTPLGNDGDAIRYRVTSGALIQVGPDTFRICPHAGPLVPQGNPWEPTLVAYKVGDDAFRPAVRPAHADVDVILKKGDAQSLTFDAIASQPAGTTTVPLRAAASSRLPVQFFVVSGPATIGADGQSLDLHAPPARAAYPIRVLVSAFQWGRPVAPQVQSAGPVTREFFLYQPGGATTRPTPPLIVPAPLDGTTL